MSFEIVCGDGLKYVREHRPRFILTDPPARFCTPLIDLTQGYMGSRCIIVYGRDWLKSTQSGEKKVDPFIRILEAFPEESLVVDPFCGWGTTGVAALACKRDFVGIEVSEDRASLARKRLSNAENAPFDYPGGMG